MRWFNPSIVEHQGNRLLAVRSSFGTPKPLGQNTIVFFRLDGKRPTARVPIEFIKTYGNEHWEDPRLAVLSNRLFLSCCNFRVPQDIRMYRAHQILVDMANSHHPAVAHVVYGRNADDMAKNTGNEKNWTWFDHRNGWHLIYESWPHHVVQTNGGAPMFKFESNPGECPWLYGTMRGGSPAVPMDDLFWCFFHSSLDFKPPLPRRRYFMGAYAFEPNPPFAIKKITTEPLLIGSEEDGGTLPVIFPGGATFVDDKWLVVFGVNDQRTAWLEIPKADLYERMIDV